MHDLESPFLLKCILFGVWGNNPIHALFSCTQTFNNGHNTVDGKLYKYFVTDTIVIFYTKVIRKEWLKYV